jgi:hypothetical protein
LQHDRAALCRLEIAEKQKELIPSGLAVEFLAAVLKVMYRTIRAFADLSTQGQDELCETSRQHVMACWVRGVPIERAHVPNGEDLLSRPAEVPTFLGQVFVI